MLRQYPSMYSHRKSSDSSGCSGNAETAETDPLLQHLISSVQLLKNYQLLCELCVRTDEEMGLAAKLVEACSTDFVVEHCARPNVKNKNERQPEWYKIRCL